MSIDLKIISDYYTDKLQTFGDTPLGVDWKDEPSQLLRFQQFNHLFQNPCQSFTILDYGCGKGDYLLFLQKNFPTFEYYGFDISPKMISFGKKKFAHAKNARFTASSKDIPPRIDYLVACGTYTVRHNFSERKWQNHIFKEIDTHYQRVEKGLALNLMTSHVDFKADHLSYLDPKNVLDSLIKKYRFVEILHDYPLYEYTVIIRK